jgi:uncharacterized protein (DUF2252 family)
MSLAMESMMRVEAIEAATLFAGAVGKAHARQMERVTRERWARALDKTRTKNLDAPSWLRKSVLDLVATHESAYLEHCRIYALNKSA